jgi:hypothetical protein
MATPKTVIAPRGRRERCGRTGTVCVTTVATLVAWRGYEVRAVQLGWPLLANQDEGGAWMTIRSADHVRQRLRAWSQSARLSI